MPSGYVFFYNDIEITGQPFRTDNGYYYPDNWCVTSTLEGLDSIGVVSLLEVWPTLEPGNYYDGSYIDNFTDLTRTYGQSAIIPGLTGTFTGNIAIPFPAGKWFVSIAIKEVDDDPEPHPEETVNIGTTPGGTDIVHDYTITHDYESISVGRYFPDAATIYITCDAKYSYTILTS